MNIRALKINKFAYALLFGILLIYVFFWDARLVNSRYVFAAILVLAVLVLAIRRSFIFSSSACVYLVIVFITAMGAIGQSQEYAVRLILQMLVCCVAFLAFHGFQLSSRVVLVAFALLSLFYTGGVFLQLVAPALVFRINSVLLTPDAFFSYQQLESYRYNSGFSGFNFMTAFFSAILLGIYLYRWFNTPTRHTGRRVVYALLVLVAFFATVIAQKRGVFVACAVAVLVSLFVMFNQKNNLKRFFSIGAGLLIFGLGVYLLLLNSESGVQFLRRFSESDDVSNGRFEIMQMVFNEIGNSFIFGKGTGASQELIHMGTHNIYLQVFFDHGAVGVFIYLTWFVINLKNVLRALRRVPADDAQRAVLFLSFFVQLLFLVYGFFGNPINDIFIFLLYVFFAAMPYAIGRQCILQKSIEQRG